MSRASVPPAKAAPGLYVSALADTRFKPQGPFDLGRICPDTLADRSKLVGKRHARSKERIDAVLDHFGGFRSTSKYLPGEFL